MARREYTKLEKPLGCVVTTIEMVTPAHSVETISEVLETLRQYGGASVVGQTLIANPEDEAYEILDSHAIRSFIGAVR
jgi:hypothetical protein